MLPALLLRLRASCLTRRRSEPYKLLCPQQCRQASGSRPRIQKPNDKESGRQEVQKSEVETRKEVDDNVSLFEELFPEEAQRRNGKASSEREVPRLTLDLRDMPDVLKPELEGGPLNRRAPEMPLDKAIYWDSMRDTKRQYAHLEKKGETMSMLVMRNASKNLVDEDFRKVIPQGKHIEGWNLERGDIVKVIPGRNSATLERLNFYFLLFKSPVSAFAYQTHVTRLHKLCQSQTPSSLTSPIPPPPGYMMGGEDVEALLQSYSLLPPSQEMNIRQLHPPFTPSVQQIMQYSGYPFIVKRLDKSPFEVLLQLEGPQLSIPNIRSAIFKVARDRGLPWTGSENHDMKVTKWEVRGSNVSPLSSKRLEDDWEGEQDRFDKAEALKHGDGPGGQDDNEPAEFRRQRRFAAPSYIIGFQTEGEAQTFVRFWHRRPMELANYDYANGDIAPIVNAEMLW